MIVIIAGSTGMVGNLVMNNCLNSEAVTEVRSLARKPTSLKHPKLKETVIEDFYGNSYASFAMSQEHINLNVN